MSDLTEQEYREYRAWLIRHNEADWLFSTRRALVVQVIYPPHHPLGRLQRFLASIPTSEERGS